jgi:adenosylcobinamide-phosphate synthase
MNEYIFIILIAMAIDGIWGDDHFFWKRIKHPIMYFGKAIERLDSEFNREEFSPNAKILNGVAVVVAMTFFVYLIGLFLEKLFSILPFSIIFEAIFVSVFIAARSLFDHVKAVNSSLMQDGLEGGRSKLSLIVGRNVSNLDLGDILRAAIESLAENFSDGVVAPVLWYLIFGIPGLLIYKLINTADSMIGHKDNKYINFGMFAARFDDFLNYIPARFSAFLIIVASFILREDWRSSIRIAKEDHNKHSSPNSGWPESAMSGALGVSLGGLRVYEQEEVDEGVMNASGERNIDDNHLTRSLWIYTTANIVGIIILSLAVITGIIF